MAQEKLAGKVEKHMAQTMNRRNIREHVFRMVFEKDFYERAELPQQLLLYLEDVEAMPEEKDYLMERALQVVDLSDQIDREIDEISESWRIGRIGKADLAILRLAVYELKHDDSIPVSVAINEAVELAKKYGGERSYGFINGILARMVKEHPELADKDPRLSRQDGKPSAEKIPAADEEGLE